MMNDRYLFRAKRIDNGEWVEGFYVCNEMHYIGVSCTEHNVVPAIRWFEADPHTVCQCTGLSDEDGKKIFDGDIVGFIDFTSTENGYSEQYCRGQVTWDKETASFQVTERLSAESYEVLDRGCKVLGNMFDNSELMEEW